MSGCATEEGLVPGPRDTLGFGPLATGHSRVWSVGHVTDKGSCREREGVCAINGNQRQSVIVKFNQCQPGRVVLR